jgi:invasion protein IalB
MRLYRSRLHAALFLALGVAAGSSAQAQTTQLPASAYSISGWRVECSSQSNALACQLIDQVVARANNGVIAGLSVQQVGAAKTPTLIVQVPLGAALDQPVRVGFNAGTAQSVPFVSCYNNGCFARAALQDSMLAQMRDAKQPLSVSYSTYNANMQKQNINITLPLDGFAVAYDKLK